MCVNPLLKIVPNKSPFYPFMLKKTTVPSCFRKLHIFVIFQCVQCQSVGLLQTAKEGRKAVKYCEDDSHVVVRNKRRKSKHTEIVLARAD